MFLLKKGLYYTSNCICYHTLPNSLIQIWNFGTFQFHWHCLCIYSSLVAALSCQMVHISRAVRVNSRDPLLDTRSLTKIQCSECGQVTYLYKRVISPKQLTMCRTICVVINVFCWLRLRQKWQDNLTHSVINY